MISTYRKIFYANEALAYFMLNEFPIVTKKCHVLDAAINPQERPNFSLEIGGDSAMQIGVGLTLRYRYFFEITLKGFLSVRKTVCFSPEVV